MTSTWRMPIVLLLIICTPCCATSQPTLAKQETPPDRSMVSTVLRQDQFADAHVHIIDFLQNGAFDNSDGQFQGVGDRGQIIKSSAIRYLALPYGEQWRRLTLLLKDMEEAGVEHAMVSGMPFLKKWSASDPFARPRYYLDSSSRMVHARDTDYLIGGAVMDYKRKFADNEAELRLAIQSPSDNW